MTAEQEVIARIHQSFEVEILEMIGDADDGPDTLASQTEFIPMGMGVSAFKRNVEYWRLKYPQNNFVTERQVEQICKKYNLVVGPSILFTGNIPAKNQREIDAFKLKNTDGLVHGLDVWRFLHEKLFQRASMNVHAPYGNGPLVFEISARFGGMFKADSVIPIGEGFVLVPGKDSEGFYMDLYAMVDRDGSEWMVFCMKIYPHNYGSRLYVSFEQINMRLITSVQMRLTEDDLLPLKRIDLNKSVSRCIVAPGTMFEAYKSSVETKDDYRLRFKSSLSMAPAMFDFYMDDPIVLQPVPGGYLVVTKWGLEASIPEVQSGQSN
jgi:hypothetical protein